MVSLLHLLRAITDEMRTLLQVYALYILSVVFKIRTYVRPELLKCNIMFR